MQLERLAGSAKLFLNEYDRRRNSHTCEFGGAFGCAGQIRDLLLPVRSRVRHYWAQPATHAVA